MSFTSLNAPFRPLSSGDNRVQIGSVVAEIFAILVANFARSNIIQIVTGIDVNSESNFPKLREYCPSAEDTRAIFPQLREIRLTIDR